MCHSTALKIRHQANFPDFHATVATLCYKDRSNESKNRGKVNSYLKSFIQRIHVLIPDSFSNPSFHSHVPFMFTQMRWRLT